MDFFRRNTIISTVLAVQLVLLTALFVVYVAVMGLYFKKIKTYILKKETSKFKGISLFIIKKERESLENILVSFAFWNKFYLYCVKKDTSWLDEQFAGNPQVESKFDMYGVFLENGTVLYYGGRRLPQDVVADIIEYFRRACRRGEAVSEFFFSFVKIGGEVYYIGAAPLSDDMGHLLSYGFVYFGRSVNRLIDAIKILTPEARLSFKASFKETTAFIPLKDAFGRVVAYIMLPFPAYIETELAKLGELELILGMLILIYAVLTYAVLKYCQKRIMRELGLMLQVAKSIKDFNPNLQILRELAGKRDEIGAVARSLLPVAEVIASRVIKDPLTGVFNREYFFARLQEELERMRRFKRPLSVAVFDIDDFKVVNDTYGHPVGDRVLKQFCELLRRHLRSTDVFARIGGEEFGLIFPETDIRGAQRVCEKLRSVIEGTEFEVNDHSVRITASFGVTQAKETDTVESLYERADRALYLAKKSGKNRVAVL